jgi:hypothetical protein
MAFQFRANRGEVSSRLECLSGFVRRLLDKKRLPGALYRETIM